MLSLFSVHDVVLLTSKDFLNAGTIRDFKLVVVDKNGFDAPRAVLSPASVGLEFAQEQRFLTTICRRLLKATLIRIALEVARCAELLL